MTIVMNVDGSVVLGSQLGYAGGYGRSANEAHNQQWAAQLFQEVIRQARSYKVTSWLRRRDNRLWHLHPATLMQQVSERQLEKVNLAQIKGSTSNRCHDFDNQFRPLQKHTQARWISVAAANRGRELPPVELVKVGDVYFVVDGHHRVSVAQALGASEITANVTVYTIIQPQ